MQRLLHEGMDAGLCGFSIQRLGPNSTQADFDGTPMVTDTMCDEDILALAEVLAERDEGFIQITQATGDTSRPTWPSWRSSPRCPAAHPAQRHRRRPRKDPDVAPAQSLRLAGAVLRARACRSTARAPPSAPASPSRSSTGTSTTPARRGATITTGTHEEKLAKMADPALRAAVEREPDEADSPSRKSSRPASAARPTTSSCRASPAAPTSSSTSGRSLGEIAADEGKHHDRGDARPVARRRPEGRVPRPRPRLQRRLSWPR